MFPSVRLRRLRRTPALRAMVEETTLRSNQLIWPIFIEEGLDAPTPITSMPGQCRWPESQISTPITQAIDAGIAGVMLFGVSHHKDEVGGDSLTDGGLLGRMIKAAKAAAGDKLIIISDNCFCEYTSHGHCGVVDDQRHVDNDQTLENLAKQAVVCATAGADMVAPSAMMDGQIEAIREALDGAGYSHIPIMAYASKFASGLYGPFRAAAGCELKGDRKAYQMDPHNGREALREAFLDEAEGADILMVKPGIFYLDVLARLRDQSLLPLAAYQVSGEYAMLKFACANGALDEKRVVMESLISLRRAGADIILTYFALDAVRWLKE